MPIPWLSGAYVVPELAERETAFPFTLPFVRELDFTLDDRVAGENGSGKSTLMNNLSTQANSPVESSDSIDIAH